VRVLIAEDLALLRDGLERLLRDNGFEVVGAVASGDDLVRLGTETEPDLAIVDVRLPPSFRDEGLRAALELRRRVPATGILVVSQYVEPTYAAELLAHGGSGRVGYLLKDRIMDVRDFVESARRVAVGGTALDPDVVAQLLARRGGDRLDDLSPREREVLALMAEGRSNGGIAETLVVTVGAVEKHVASILAKLRLPPSGSDHRRVLAVLAYLQEQG
jgi:DNA-binding NarL/FixJ family response regulator